MTASGVGQRDAAAILAAWREVESAIAAVRSSGAQGPDQLAELAGLHAEARRLRVEYAEMIRRPTPAAPAAR